MKSLIDIYRKLRSSYYRIKYGLNNVHTDIYFGGPSQISGDLKTEHDVYIGAGCQIYPKVSIGAYSMLANNVCIIGGDHKYNFAGVPIMYSGRAELKATTIERDCWIGASSIIMCGVTIGEGSIVAAGSVVVKDVEPYSIYGGIPARKIRPRFATEEEIAKHRSILREDNKENITKFKLCDGLGSWNR
jgi:acetyltransferase-like isoleucine patch superfamily enzyme